MSSTASAQNTTNFVEEMGSVNAVKNQVFFKVKGTKAYIMSPVTYLNDNDPRKTEAVDYINERFERMIIEWNQFAYKFQQIDDKQIEAILNSNDDNQIDRLVEYLESDADKLSMQKMILKYTGLPTFEQRQANQFLAEYSFFSKEQLSRLMKKTESEQLEAFLDQLNSKIDKEEYKEILSRFPEQHSALVQAVINRSYSEQKQLGQLRVLYSELKTNSPEPNALDEMLQGSMQKMSKSLLDYLLEIQKNDKRSFLSKSFAKDDRSPLQKHFQSVIDSDYKVDSESLSEILEEEDAFDRLQKFSAYFHKVKLSDPDLYGKSYSASFSRSQIKALAERQLKKANEFVTNQGFNIGEEPKLPSLEELQDQKINEYNKNMTYFLNKTIELREDFEKSFTNLGVLTDEEQAALKYSFHSSLPDVYVLQIQGRFLERLFGLSKKLGTKEPVKKPGSGIDLGNGIGNNFGQAADPQDPSKVPHKKNLVEKIFTSNPLLYNIFQVLKGVVSANRLRFAIFVRPWAVTEINLTNGESTQYIESEKSFNVFANINTNVNAVSRAENFFRASVGGIWANMRNLEDMDYNMFVGASYSRTTFNVKAGITHPWYGEEEFSDFPPIPYMSRKELNRDNMPEKWGGYIFVGLQQGETPVPTVENGGLMGPPTNPADKNIISRAMSRLKHKPYLDVSITKNVLNVFQTLGVDSSFLSDELKRLLGLNTNGGSGGAYGCPSWICGNSNGTIIGGGNDNGGGSDIPVLGGGGTIIIDEPGSGIFITEDMEDYMATYLEENKEDYRKCWLSLPDVKRREFFIDRHFRGFSTLCLPMDELFQKAQLNSQVPLNTELQEVNEATK